MSIAIDANILLYASDEQSPRYRAARDVLQQVAEGPELVYLFWPVVMAYLRIVTHPRIFDQPLEPKIAQANVNSLLERPHVRSPGEKAGFWRIYLNTVDSDIIRGNLVPDSHIAALMRHHGVNTILSSDRDFHRFSDITVRDLDQD